MSLSTDWGSDGPNCSSLSCPRIHHVELEYRVPVDELGTDFEGHCWCNYCYRQLELMNWGHLNHYPSVRVQGKMVYAVFGGVNSWFLSIAGANQDMVSALHETLVEGKRAPLPPIE